MAIEMHRCFLLSLQQTLTSMTADVCSGSPSFVAMETVSVITGFTYMSRRDYCGASGLLKSPFAEVNDTRSHSSS